jgi:hypothetical protein
MDQIVLHILLALQSSVLVPEKVLIVIKVCAVCNVVIVEVL